MDSKLFDYMVTIRCMTYQQADYIIDALQNMVIQDTSFPFLILVVDDASTDGTAQLIRKFIDDEFATNDTSVSWHEHDDDSDNLFAQHRSRRNCFILSMNLQKNLYKDQPKKRKLFARWIECSKYVAICDGDDFWIDRHKLQKQVDFLEAHPDYQLVFHNAIVRYQDSLIPDCIMRSFKAGTFSTANIFEIWHLSWSSIVYRSEIEEAEVFKKLSAGYAVDLARFLSASMLGKVYGMAECMSVYRKNNGGVSKTMRPSRFMYNGNEMAIATGDKEAIEVRRKRTIQFLIGYMPAILRGDDKVADLWGMAKRYYPLAPYEALAKYLFIQTPMRIVRKVKHKIFGN